MDEDGVSPVIGTIMVLSILTVVTSTMLTVVWPQIQDNQQSGEFQVVTSQFSRLGADANQMALGGNMGEIRQRTVAMADGQLSLRPGHLWAISTGLEDENYSNVAGLTRDPGDHPEFSVAVDDAEYPGSPVLATHSSFKVEDEGDRGVTYEVHRFTGTRWQDPDPDGGPLGGSATGSDFTVTLPVSQMLRDGPWRVQIFDADDALIGEVYIYELGRLTYSLEGRLTSREAILENGALFTREDTSMFSQSAGLYRTAASGGGTGGLNLRAAHLAASGSTESSGQAKTTVHMTLTAHEHLAHDQGAIHARLQALSGPHTNAWASHLTGGDFDPDTDNTGVVFTWDSGEDGKIETFPFSVAYSELRVRMVAG